jgi:predicted RNase H-like HicB family nuclease
MGSTPVHGARVFREKPAAPSAVDRVMRLSIVLERRPDGRWVAEIPQLPKVAVLGNDRLEAFRRAQASALRLLADELDGDQAFPGYPMELAVAFTMA